MNHLTNSDALKLRVIGQRLRDIFDRDGTNPIERGTTDYVVRSVIEALKLDHIFYDQDNSPFIPPEEESDVIQWRKEINAEIKDLYDKVNLLEENTK